MGHTLSQWTGNLAFTVNTSCYQIPFANQLNVTIAILLEDRTKFIRDNDDKLYLPLAFQDPLAINISGRRNILLPEFSDLGINRYKKCNESELYDPIKLWVPLSLYPMSFLKFNLQLIS